MITITGSLVNRGAWIGANSGLTSYEGIKKQLADAVADDRVKAIVLDIESPGGLAVGAFETAAAVRDALAVKPVTAIVNGMAASAAYAIASGAGKIVSIESGISGSIGVRLIHLDNSRKLDREGVTPTIISAGDGKADANPFQPLTGEVADRAAGGSRQDLRPLHRDGRDRPQKAFGALDPRAGRPSLRWPGRSRRGPGR